MSDRRKMVAFISSQLPEGEASVILGGNSESRITAHVMVMGDDIEIASNCPEWVSVREVYEYLRWNTMTSWEQHAAIHLAKSAGTPSAATRLERVADRMESFLSTIPRMEDNQGTTPQRTPQTVRRSPEDEALTTQDVASLLGCSYTEARERLLDGRIKAVKDGRWLRTRREWVDDYITRKMVEASQTAGVELVPAPPKHRTQATIKTSGIGYRFLKDRAK